MGIPYYVASLVRSHKQKNIQQDIGNAAIDVDVLGIDFNCLIHTYLKASNPIGSVVVAVHELLTKTVQARKVYLAFDGLVPMAKMVQQRYRRFRKPDGIQDFDKHQISPGTPFMRELADTLRFMFPEIVISDTLERGEGEHKIFQWLRTVPEEQRQKICIYGMDADLVLISLAQSHLGNIYLLREKQDEGFRTLSISALRGVLPLPLDEYLRMSIMCFGNDFMPNLAMFSLRQDGYTRALHYAHKETAGKDELKILIKRAAENSPHIVASDGHALESRYAAHLMDGVLNWQPVVYAFWKTFAWTYHYFTTSEVLDWDWYYPYPEAPLVSVLDDYDITTEFTWDHPDPSYTVEDQLQFILPSHSLPPGLTVKHVDELYDEAHDTRHPFMRKFAWECDPYISLPCTKLTSVTEIHLGQGQV